MITSCYIILFIQSRACENFLAILIKCNLELYCGRFEFDDFFSIAETIKACTYALKTCFSCIGSSHNFKF